MKATLSEWLHLPKKNVGAAAVDNIRRVLTVQPRPNEDGTPRDPIYMFRETTDTLSVPVHWGLKYFPNLVFDDKTSLGEQMKGVTKLPSPYNERVEDPESQKAFMDAMVEAARTNYVFNATAPTGSGKSVVGLRTAAVLGRKTLVVVHLDDLAKNWMEEAHTHLGIPKERIGQVFGTKIKYKDCDIVVCIYNSLAKKEMPKDFYTSFGTVIFDEVHKTGAATFSRVMTLFPARYRIGLTATLRRKDDTRKVFLYSLGEAIVKSEAKALPMRLFPIYFQSRQRMWGSNHATACKCVAEDPRRNNLIARIAMTCYQNNRNLLIVSFSVAHLCLLRELMISKGANPDDLGIFARSHPTFRGKALKAELERVKKESKVIFAPYQMMKEGTNIPRLDAGIDATPETDAEQLNGRIRRPVPGKKVPVWYTLVDVASDRFMRYYKSRLKDYMSSNVQVMDHGKQRKIYTE